MKRRRLNISALLVTLLCAACTGSRPMEGDYRIRFNGNAGAYLQEFDLQVTDTRKDSVEMYQEAQRSVLQKNGKELSGALRINDVSLGQVQQQTPFLLQGTLKGNEAEGGFETVIITYTNPTVYYDTIQGSFTLFPRN
ncbi:MAG: hypothetical protein IBJ09_15115 [Bacteroidia bacterium]|nr:hypothetical protein [Bacteroidia bacterium]